MWASQTARPQLRSQITFTPYANGSPPYLHANVSLGQHFGQTFGPAFRPRLRPQGQDVARRTLGWKLVFEPQATSRGTPHVLLHTAMGIPT
jgi:hypothetical protein